MTYQEKLADGVGGPVISWDRIGQPVPTSQPLDVWDADTLARLRRTVRDLVHPCTRVAVSCFSESEANLIRAELTPEEKDKCVFSWMVFE